MRQINRSNLIFLKWPMFEKIQWYPLGYVFSLWRKWHFTVIFTRHLSKLKKKSLFSPIIISFFDVKKDHNFIFWCKKRVVSTNNGVTSLFTVLTTQTPFFPKSYPNSWIIEKMDFLHHQKRDYVKWKINVNFTLNSSYFNHSAIMMCAANCTHKGTLLRWFRAVFIPFQWFLVINVRFKGNS